MNSYSWKYKDKLNKKRNGIKGIGSDVTMKRRISEEKGKKKKGMFQWI